MFFEAFFQDPHHFTIIHEIMVLGYAGGLQASITDGNLCL